MHGDAPDGLPFAEYDDFAPTGVADGDHVNAVERSAINEFPQPRQELLVAGGFRIHEEEALLQAFPEIEQSGRYPVAPPVVGYVVTDEVTHGVAKSSG